MNTKSILAPPIVDASKKVKKAAKYTWKLIVGSILFAGSLFSLIYYVYWWRHTFPSIPGRSLIPSTKVYTTSDYVVFGPYGVGSLKHATPVLQKSEHQNCWDIDLSNAFSPKDVQEFWMSSHTVSVGEFKKFIADQPSTQFDKVTMPPAPTWNLGWLRDDLPMVNVTFREAESYADAQGGYIPSRDQMIAATFGGSADEWFPKGNFFSDTSVISSHSEPRTSPIGENDSIDASYKNSLGVYHAEGNVWVWLSDSHDTDHELVYGGAYDIAETGSFRRAYRHWLTKYLRYPDLGFRVAWSVKDNE